MQAELNNDMDIGIQKINFGGLILCRRFKKTKNIQLVYFTS